MAISALAARSIHNFSLPQEKPAAGFPPQAFSFYTCIMRMIFVAEDFRRFISRLTPAAMTQRLSSRKFFPFQNGNGPIVQIIFVLRIVPPETVEVLPFLLRNWNKKFTLVCKVKYFPLFFSK